MKLICLGMHFAGARLLFGRGHFPEDPAALNAILNEHQQSIKKRFGNSPK